MSEDILYSLIEKGSVEGYTSIPLTIETLISRLFVFDTEGVVLKFYKRDNAWWNTSMCDISTGETRRTFIRTDFEFNAFLNPETYLRLQAVSIVNGRIVLSDDVSGTDELVIVMKKIDMSGVFTDILWQHKNAEVNMFDIGVQFAQKKQAIPHSFLPNSTSNWYQQILTRVEGLRDWVTDDIPAALTEQSFKCLLNVIDTEKTFFESIRNEDLSVLIDCNSENIVISNGQLAFMDAFPPKAEWRSGTFDVDIYRVGTDIYAALGKDAFDEYLRGVLSVAADRLTPRLEKFYIVYAAMIATSYFYMLSRNDGKYVPIAKKYQDFLALKI